MRELGLGDMVDAGAPDREDAREEKLELAERRSQEGRGGPAEQQCPWGRPKPPRAKLKQRATADRRTHGSLQEKCAWKK